MNLVVLKGNVGKDPEVREFDNGGKIAQFSLATTERGYKTKDGRDIPDETTWHNIVVKQPGLATVCEKYVKKGASLLVSGKISNRSYDDSNGIKRYVTEIVIDKLDILGSGEKKEESAQPQPAEPMQAENSMDDLPF